MTPVYMALQLVRGTAATVTCGTGGLLPRLFTLAPRKKKQNLEAVILCYLSCILADAFPLGSTMPCVARTFLFPLRDSDRTACYLSKNVRFAAVFRKSFVILSCKSTIKTGYMATCRAIIFIAAALFFGAVAARAQDNRVARAVVLRGDTLPHFDLGEAQAFPSARHAARYYRRERRNVRLEYNVRKVYPYARIAAAKISEIEAKLAQTSKESERRQIIKDEYSQLMKTFKAPLMRLTITQGRILIRLIYRETNNTSFSHIREYRGAVNAYFWQSIALLFGHNLKAGYDPRGEDAEIEAIVRRIERENAPLP